MSGNFMHPLSILICRILVLSGAALLFSSCSGFMAEAAIHRPTIEPGTPRREIVAELGTPRMSVQVQPTRLGATLAGAPKTIHARRVARFDEYLVSGLAQFPGDPYYDEWNVYPAVVILTGGAIEAVVFPITAGDLARRSVTRQKLRLWYDPRERLLGYSRG